MSAGRRIDHVVVAVKDLDRAAAAYSGLGFTLTPRASHPDAMGTANRLAQFAGRNFIELIEVDRPQTVADHDFGQSPPAFSFGAHIRAFTGMREGMAALVLASTDARADYQRLTAEGVQAFAPVEFERAATLPDGAEVTVAFTLTFATDPTMPSLLFFLCQNHYPENFWKPKFQIHENMAKSISAVYLSTSEPQRHREFLRKLTDGEVESSGSGYRITCGRDQTLTVMTADDAPAAGGYGMGPQFTGIAIASNKKGLARVTPGQGCGMFIQWV